MIENEDELNPTERKQLKFLLDLERGLSKWEVDFIESISHLDRGLTPKESAKLAEIYFDKK